MDRERCPKCGCSWIVEMSESLLDSFKRKRAEGDPYWKTTTDAEMAEFINTWYPNGSPTHSFRAMGVEYRYCTTERFDGIGEYICPDCGARIGRWSGKELPPGYYERPYGGEPIKGEINE